MLLNRLGSALKPRGFFCDDKSLMYPIHKSTVSNTAVTVVSLLFPLITIVITEILRVAQDTTKLSCYKKVYKFYKIYLFGLSTNQIITDTTKFLIGRLRPYFFDVCRPILPNNSTCSEVENMNRFIEDFKCNTDLTTSTDFRELFLSFPSGHASMSFCTMIFAVIYLQFRMSWRGSKFLKHLIQFLMISIALAVTLTRIMDYRHHCECETNLINQISFISKETILKLS